MNNVVYSNWFQAITSLNTVLGLTVLTISALHWLTKRQFKLAQAELERIADQRKRDVDQLQGELENSRTEIEKLRASIPSAWLQIAERERTEGYEELAVEA